MNSADNSLIRPRNPFERRVVQAIAAAKPRMSVGIVETPLPGGTSLTALNRSRRSGSGTHPFFIVQSSGLMHVGTVSGEIPTLDSAPIGLDGSALDLTDLSGNFFVYLKADFDLVFGTHHFLTAADATAYTIVTSGSALSDALNLTLLTFTTYRLIAQVIEEQVVRTQTTTTNLNLSVCDASDGTEEGRNVNATWSSAD